MPVKLQKREREKKKGKKSTCFPYMSRLASAAQITLKYLDVTAQVSYGFVSKRQSQVPYH
jgi:hypothetical protein